MIQLFVLVAWSSTGVALAAVLSPEPGRRLAWAPMAVFLGPLWASVAGERLLTKAQPVVARSSVVRRGSEGKVRVR